MTRLEQLRRALEVLSSSADEQIHYLSAIGHFADHQIDISNVDGRWNVDEIALQFEDIACARDDMVGKAEISEALCDCVAKLDEVLASHSGEANAAFWTVGALKSDERWEKIRREARDCLSIT